FPVFAMGWNERLGWADTVNVLQNYTVYALTLRDGGYEYDGKTLPFESDHRELKIKQSDGTLRSEPLAVERSLHGPVIFKDGGRAFALRVAGIDQSGILEQSWDMVRARDLASFTAALKRLQIPMFAVTYADRDGHIMYFDGGRIPRHASGDWSTWSGVVPGN